MSNGEKLPGFSYNGRPPGNPFAPFIYALILSFGVMLGFLINSISSGKQTVLHARGNKIEDVLNYIEYKYVDSVNRNDLVNKSIEKILAGLDPHSVYIPAREVSEANESLEGNFEGIGIEFYMVQDTITVVNVIPGGPSELTGVKAGDRIIKINDSIVAGRKINEADVKHRLRGPKGTAVKVTMLRPGSHPLIDFHITRDKIVLSSVEAAYMMADSIGYIRIGSFSATTHEEFRQKISSLLEHGMKKLIIDLRSNPGGYLEAATALADELLSGQKLIVYTKGRAYEREDFKAGKPGLFEQGPLCILINQGSASASEILSGAIQDWDRGAIIGRTSFGKGLVQQQLDLSDGSVLRLTVARYYTPSGRCIQRPYNKGIEEYYNEPYQRAELLHEDTLPGTDTTVYKTSKGRRVYGGGGIRPDIFVPIDTSIENDYFIAVNTFVAEFVYKYSSNHPEILEKYHTEEDFRKNFNVNEALLAEFYQYAGAEGLKEDKKRDKGVEEKLKLSLKAFLARQEWRFEGYYYVINENDPVVKVAVKTLEKGGN